ncbi:TPA: conjugal transfer protein TraI, partial [Escherichia coli]|nr:conjugal transfer protein TraI [Escherichia coli]
LDKLKPKARKDGTMAYSTIDGGIVIDRKTHVQAQKATTGAALVALELASKRFEGQALIVEGTDEFRLEVAQLAGMHGLKVTFTDPAMEQMRRETAEHKEMEKAIQAEVRGQKSTQVREGSKSAAPAPQRGKKRPERRSNDLT